MEHQGQEAWEGPEVEPGCSQLRDGISRKAKTYGPQKWDRPTHRRRDPAEPEGGFCSQLRLGLPKKGQASCLGESGEHGAGQSSSRRQTRLRNPASCYNDLILTGRCTKLCLAQHPARIPPWQASPTQMPGSLTWALTCDFGELSSGPRHLGPTLITWFPSFFPSPFLKQPGCLK